MADVEDAGMIETFDDEEDDDDQGGSQWFNNTADEEIDYKEGQKVTYMEDTDEEVESDALSDDEEDSLFFSDEDDNISIYTEHKGQPGELGGMNKTAQLGAEVAQAKQQLQLVYTKLEECEKSVENGREEVEQCRSRQKGLQKELAVTENEITASQGNIPNVQRLTNLKNRLQNELRAELELEESLEDYVKSQELALNQVMHEKGQYQHLELMLNTKEKTLADIKSNLMLERKQREKKILVNAERQAISNELRESLVNLEHENRTKAAIAAARKAQAEGQRYVKETWKRVKERERKEQDQLRQEGERRVKMLLQYKENLHKTQHKLKRNSVRKRRTEKEREVQRMAATAEDRFQATQKQIAAQKKAQFESTQRQAKSALINKILNEEQAIEKRKTQQPQLFTDRLKGRHNKPTPQKYKHIIDLTKSPRGSRPEVQNDKVVEQTVGYSSSSEEEPEEAHVAVSSSKDVVTSSLDQDNVLIEPEFRGLWEAAPPKKQLPPSRFSKLEQQKMAEVLQRQRDNIVQKQITVQREFKGQAFMSKPEEVIFSDYIVGETYSQNLTLTNVSYTINTLKLIGLSNNLLDFITVDFTPPGHLSAGLTCDLKVTFTPLINEDIKGEIKMLGQTGAFSIPVECRIKRTQISVPNTSIDFGTVCVGEHQRAYIKIVNSGALGTGYRVRPVGWVENEPEAIVPESQGCSEKEEENLVSSQVEEGKIPIKEDDAGKDVASTAGTFQESSTLPGTPISSRPDEVPPSFAKVEEAMQGPLEGEIQSASLLDIKPTHEKTVIPDISLNKSTTRGFIEPNSTVQVEVIYNPVQVAHHVNRFEVSVDDGSMEPVTVTVRANTIDLPVYVQEQDIYLKYCMVDWLYQDSVVLHNRATSALRIKFEIPSLLRDHVDVLPQNGVVQANSSFSAQLKFIPLSSIFKDCRKFFGEGQLLKIPIRVRVADQTRCVPFTVSAHVTGTDISFSAKELDFGCCSIYESVRMPFSMTNHCLLPQLFGFVSVPDFVTIQPNDGFGTLLPGETLDLEAVVHAKVLGDHNFSITCTTEIDRHFSLRCRATGVIPHLEVSQPLIRFAPTALGDVRQASFYISNNSKSEDGSRKNEIMRKSFHIVVPEGIDLTVSPSVGTLNPGQRLRVQLTFGPTLKKEDIENEAMEAARQEVLKEMERKKKEEAENERVTESVAGNKKGKSKKGSSKPHTPKSPQAVHTPNPLDNIVITDEARIAAMIKLKTNFRERFEKVLIPCFTSAGECTHDKTLDYKLSDTIYLQVHLPAVKPELVLLSQNGSSIVDFGNVCIGQTKKLELTLKSISEEPVSLSTSAFPHDGTFQKVNATRDLAPLGLHQMILEFTPRTKAKYYEVVEVRTNKSTLHLHLHGCGVEPSLVVSPDSGTLDLGHVMVGEILHGTFTLKNNSEIDLQYGISLLSEKPDVVQAFSGPSEIGNSNKSGILPFQCTPHTGNIPRGKTQEITVKFTPDHRDTYKDVVIINLLNQPQETRIEVKGQSWTGSMYVIGGRDPIPSVTLHTLVPQIEDPNAEPEPEEMRGEFWVVFVCSLSAPKQTFTETVSIGNCRGAGWKPDALSSKDKAPKPSGDFVFDPLKADYGPLVKALTINPPKGSVESCTTVPVSFQFSPPKELAEVGSRLQFNTMLTLKGETVEQFRSLAAPYNIGINEKNELGVVSEAARRLAAASVPLLCGTTNCDHLISLLDSISLLSSDLQNHSQVKHYVDRICFYLDRNPNPKLQKKIQQIFPKLTAAYKSQSWQTGAPRSSPRQPRISHVQKPSCAQHVPGPEVFLLRDDEVEKVALLTMADLRDSLPSVACEMASYEAAWRGASGSTAAALKLALTANISQQAENLVKDEVAEPLPAEEPPRKSVLLPKAKAPRTGREVVDHILSGMLTTQTFIAYLNKPNPTRPYHLIVVPKSKLQPEHFIMSSFGVMHVLPNGDNEVYSLSKWLRNAQIYDHIIEIRFFKHFNLLRHFLRWRINAVLERFERHRNIIKSELLIVVPTFGKNLLQIHALIYELMTVPKSSIEHVIPGTLKNFSDTAKKQLQFLIKYLTRFLHYTKQLDSTADQYLTNRLHDATANNRPSPDYLTNPISVQKEKKHMRLQYLQLCRCQHSCLPNYRRSVQFMVQNLVVNFITDSTIHLIGKIEKFIGESSGSLVTINLVYGLNKESNDVIISYPPIEKIETTLSSLLPNIASSVLSCAKEWLPDNKLLETDKINQILTYNKTYVDSLSRYKEVLNKALCEVQEYCREKEWLCEIRAFVRTWKSVERYKGAQASYIQEVLEKLKFWSQHVESLTTEFDTSNNLFHISCSALYSALQPALGDIYESLVAMVQTEFDERGARLIEETQNKHQMLKSQKAEVSSFAEYAKTLSSVKLNTEELLAEKEYIKSLYGILQKLKIDNPLMAEIDKRLQLQWELYLMVLHDGETFINKEAPAMLQGLDEQIKTLEIEAELILRKISQADSPYCNPNTDQKYIMPLVEDAKKKIAELKETMTTYSDWKFSITNNYHNMQKIQIVQTKVDARYEVWSTLQTVSSTVQTWQDTKFSEFDTISASAQIQTWLQTADYLRSVLPERDRILTTLDIKIDNVSKFVPLLVQLSSESVKSHHWQEIHICMSEMYDSKQALYVSHLMTSKLLQNKDVISRICGQALTEHTLEQSMVELEQYWENREFTLRKISIPKENPNKNRKPASESVFILDSEDNIVGQIDDHQVLLQSILASPYVKELHSRAETWLVLLQQLHVIMHLWPVCHTNWLYLTEAYVEGKTDVLDEEDIHILLECDRDFRQLLIVTWEDPLVMSLFGKKSLSNVRELQGDKLILRLETLQRHQESLMRQMGLVVQSTREKIPRLHFLSEEDLLSVLTNADSLATAKHVTTACFPHILDITVEPRMDEKDPPKITHIHGIGGEVVPLLQPVVLSAKLLEWLPQLQAMIVSTLHNMMYYSLLNVEKTELNCGQLETLLGDLHVQTDPYSESGSHKKYIQTEGNLQTWLSDYPFQCVLTTHNVVFTIKLSQWISKRISYADINSWVHVSYDTLVKALRELNTRCPLSSRKSAALQSLLLQFLAQRDILNALRTVESLSPTSFAVLAVPKFTISPQLGKFDWLSSMLPANCVKSSPRIDITVSQLTAEMTYDYEYLGRYTRLVITPITERVQFSLVAAITLRQTLAINGPSNSGKFETVKDYANMLGRYCVEYSDTLQPLLLSHLLAGLIQTGCWVVVRMFERSDLLSELGQVLQGIHRGFASLADARLFNEQKCPVIPSISNFNRPSSHEPPSKINWEFQTPPPHRPDTVSAQLNLSSGNVPPVPNYLGNIMVGESLVPASGSFQCILTLPTSQPLPLNLKDSCRAMSMMLPDLDTIILAKLISAGYKFYDHLAVKLSCFITYLDPMVVDLELYTLPIVKSILNFTTSSIQSHESNSEQFSTVSLTSVDETMTQIEEERLLIDAVVSALTPMLSSHQRGLMKQVLQEVFPLSVSHVYNMTVPPRVKAMVMEQFESNKYEVVPAMLDKTLELYHVIQNRKCVIVAGPTGCGKTTMFRILSNAINFMQATEARAQKEMERRVSGTVKPGSYTITPSMSKLGTPQPTEYGSRDPSVMGTAPPSTTEMRHRPARNEKLKGLISKSLLAPQRALNILQKPDIRVDSVMSNNPEVTQIESQKIRTLRLFVNTITFDEFVGSGVLGSEDGVFISMVKKFSSTSSLDNNLQNWILLDGNMKTYMESLLSTAISNRVISSLDASQTRIRDNIQFFIETDSLANVSPSFITKCGVVIVNASIVGWRQRFRSWLKKAEKDFYLTKSRVFTLTVLMETFIGQMIQFLDVHMRFIIRTDKNHTQEVSALLRWLNVLFTRYIGCRNGEDGENSEEYLDSITILIFIMSYVWSFGANIDAGSLEAFSEFVKQQIQESNHKVTFPETGTVLDWCINAEKLRFDLWKDYFADVKAQSSVTFTTTLLHETTLHLTELLQGSGVPVLIAGPSSSGKSSFIQNCIMPKLHPTKIKVSHLSTKRALEDSIENRLIQFQRRQQAMATSIIPSLLIEDFNVIPNKGSKIGLQEVLRKVLAHGETYSFKRRVYRNLGSTHLILTCNSVDSVGAGGRVAIGNVIERLSKSFNILPYQEPSEYEWRGIFYPVVLSWLDDFPAYKLAMKSVLATAIVGATCEIYHLLKERLKPVPGFTHCIFDAHSLSQVFQGIFLLSPTSKFRQMRQSLKGTTGPQADRRRGQSLSKSKSVAADREMFKTVAHLWNHEIQRVFSDRICGDQIRSEIYRNTNEVMKKYFCQPVIETDKSHKDASKKLEGLYSTNLCNNMKRYMQGLLLEDLEELEPGEPLLDADELMADLPVIASDLIFTKYLVENSETYAEETVPAIQEKLDSIMTSSNVSGTFGTQTLVSFSRAAKHCARLSRSFMLGGLSILLGPSGSGRKILAQATAIAHNYSFRHIPRKSSSIDFTEMLRSAMVEANAAPVLLFIEDGWTVDDYADLMYFISEGNHPSLIESSALSTSSYGNVNMDVFYKRVQSQLHVVLSLNCDGGILPDHVIKLIATYPCVLKKCLAVDYYDLWPPATLAEIAFSFLERYQHQKDPEYKISRYSPDSESTAELQSDQNPLYLGKQLTSMLSNLAAIIHLVALNIGLEEIPEISSFVNPASFLDLLHLYTVMETRIKSQIMSKLNVFTLVNEKIAQVEEILKTKKAKLAGLAPVLKTAQLVYQGWAEEIKKDKVEFHKSQEACKVEEENIERKQQELSELKQLNDLDLKEVSPVLEKAVEALSCINKADIVELKSYKNPPEVVKFSLEALCVLFDRDTSWDSAVLLLQDASLLKNIVNLQKDKIKMSTLKLLKKNYLDDPEFTQEAISRVSKATNSIQAYISGIYKYSTTIKKLKPRQKRYEKISTDLEQSQKSLGKKLLHLDEFQKSMDAKAVNVEESSAQIKNIQSTIKALKKEVRAAEKILDAVKQKTKQWAAEKEELDQQLLKADGDALLAAGAITYFGPFSGEIRSKLLKTWIDGSFPGKSFITEGFVSTSRNFDLVSFLSTPTELLDLEKQGLPKDRESIENLLIIRELLKHSRRKILISDPDDQLRQWAPLLVSPAAGDPSTAKLSDSTSEVTSHLVAAPPSTTSSSVMRGSEVDLCQSGVGEGVLWYSVEEVMDQEQGGAGRSVGSLKNTLSIVTGVWDRGVSMTSLPTLQSDNCVLTSSLTTNQLSFKPLSETAVVTFKLSQSGITSALLKLIVSKQAPHLNTRECSYARSKLNRIAAMEHAEKSLLDYITTFKGSLLDSKDLSSLIEGTQELISNEELAIADINSRLSGLRDKTEEYRPLANHGAVIVEVFQEINTLSYHYNFKLSDLTEILAGVVSKRGPDSLSSAAKVADYKKELHKEVYKKLQLFMSRSDAGFFPLLLVMKEFLRSNRMTFEEFDLFLNHFLHQFPYVPDEIPNWITKSCWQSLDLLEELPVFKGLKQHMQLNQALYQEYFTLAPVLLEPSPWDDERKLTLAQRALLWLFARPKDMSKVFSDLIMYELGSEMMTTLVHHPLTISENSPSLIITDSDDQLDAVHDVQRIATTQNRTVKVLCMLSDSVQREAEHMIQQGIKYGYWIVLSQCHHIKIWSGLLLDMMLEISEIVANPRESLPKKVHPSFKLILVSSLSSKMTLPDELTSKFSVKTHHSAGSLVGRVEQRAKRFLEVEVPLNKKNVPSQIPSVMSQLHSYLISNYELEDQESQGLSWGDSDINSTLHLLCHMSQNKRVDILDCARSLVSLVTYGSKSTSDTQTTFLFSAIDRFLTFDIDEMPPQPSILQFQLASSSLTFKSLPDIPSDSANTILSLRRFSNSEQSMDISFVINFILSSLPSAPRVVPSRGHTALSLFFAVQAEYYTKLLSRVSDDIWTIKDVMMGDRTPSEITTTLINELSRNRVPDSWEPGYSRGLGRWLSDLADKVWKLSKLTGTETQSEMSGRHSSATTTDLDQSVFYSLSAFTNPRHFILSYLYDWATSNGVALSDVAFNTKVVSLTSPGLVPDNGIYLDGLELRRAGWDTVKGLMYPTSSSAPPFPLPPILLIPYNKQEEGSSTTSLPQMTASRIDCAVVTRRGDFVSTFVLPSSHTLNHWAHLKPSILVT